jgi:hypothetical protein
MISEDTCILLSVLNLSNTDGGVGFVISENMVFVIDGLLSFLLGTLDSFFVSAGDSSIPLKAE